MVLQQNRNKRLTFTTLNKILPVVEKSSINQPCLDPSRRKRHRRSSTANSPLIVKSHSET